MARFLVTGVAGFIGRSIAKQLLDDGHTVRGIDNFATGKRENLDGLRNLDFLEGDITDPAAISRACKGIDIIFHEAALASVPRSVADPIGTHHANVTGTITLLEGARLGNVKRVVYAGSSSAYGETAVLPKREDMLPCPVSPYAVSKLAGEYYMAAYFRVYGLETVTLRYFNVFGPYQDPASQYSGVLARFIPMMLRGEAPTIHGDGEQSRDFTYIRNVVEANLLAASAPSQKVAGQVFNVATAQAITLNDTVKCLRRITAYQGPVHYGPERQGDVRHSLADISAATQALGYEPGVLFEEGLRRTVEWYANALSVRS